MICPWAPRPMSNNVEATTTRRAGNSRLITVNLIGSPITDWGRHLAWRCAKPSSCRRRLSCGDAQLREVPDFDGVVAACRVQAPTVGAEGHAADQGLMT